MNLTTMLWEPINRIGLSGEVRTGTVQRGVQFKVLAVNRLPDAFYASPALVGDAIFLRGQEHLYCFQHRAD